MAGDKTYSGSCLCGAIRFEAKGRPRKPHTCSCKMCQRHSGALTTAWVEFAKEEVRWNGEGGEPATWRSSDASSRAFCSTCGSTLGAIDDAPVVALLLGIFDDLDDEDLIPVSHSYADGKPGW